MEKQSFMPGFLQYVEVRLALCTKDNTTKGNIKAEKLIQKIIFANTSPDLKDLRSNWGNSVDSLGPPSVTVQLMIMS